MKQLANNLWFLQYELSMLGADMHRNVTVMRLASGDLVIHSTAPFTAQDVAAIRAEGTPRWMMDVMMRHDTFAKQGREAFPDAAYLAPEGFSEVVGFPTQPLVDQPGWNGEVEVLPLAGVPSMKEHAVLHRPSRTLIVADLFFDFGPDESAWTKFLMLLAVGPHHDPGVPRPLRMAVKDKEAFQGSLATMMSWDFDRLIPGHGSVIETGAKSRVAEALRAVGF